MALISGVTIPDNKQVEIALTYIHGLGRPTSRAILSEAKIEPNVRVKNLTDGELARLQEIISGSYTIEGDLRRVVTANVKRLKDVKAYRGFRHAANLPVRGQRTKTNARTKRGKRMTVGGTARKAPEKT